MQIKMMDIIENYEGMSLEAISLLSQVPPFIPIITLIV